MTASTTTVSAAAFTASIGVNTHLDHYWSAYSNTATVIGDLQYLGVGKVRDSMASTQDASLFETVAAAAGVKFDAYLSVSGLSYDQEIAAMRSMAGILVSVEGLNEGDASLSTLSYGGQTGYAAIAALQTALYDTFGSSSATQPLPVIGPSYGVVANIGLAASTAAVSDDGNIHEYFGTGNPPGPSLSDIVGAQTTVSGTDPVVATETGYYTGPSLSGTVSAYQVSGVTELVQAKYELTLLFDNWKAGIKTTYLYELLDDASDPGNTDNEDHYGLFDADGTPKLAATAIHDLMATLADQGTARTDGFGYQIAGAPSTANSLLLEKSTGVFDLAIWNDIRLSDSVTGAQLVDPAVPVTLTFGQYVQSVVEYDPLLGTGAVQTWSNVSAISIDLPDHPVIFEITPYTSSQFSLQSFVLPETVASAQSSGNLWTSLIAEATDTDPNKLTGLKIISVGTLGTLGSVRFDAASQSVVYTAPTYSPLTPTDSFTYTLADAAGDTVTGTVAITETPPADTLYDTAADFRINAPTTGWTLVALAAGEQLYSDYANTTFIGAGDTAMYGGTDNNVFTAGDGNHIVGGGNFAQVTLGNGNNTIGLSGTGNVVVAGNGNNLLWKSTGNTRITLGDGNESITAGGANNVIRVGTGTSSIDVGVDGSAAGNESVTIGGGTNTVQAGGAGDTIVVAGGTGNLIVAAGATANVTLQAGSTKLVLQGAGSVATSVSGSNYVESGTDDETVNLGSGNDAAWLAGNANRVVAGSGTASITFLGQHDVIDVTHGTVTLTAQGSLDTLVLAAPGGTATQIYGNVVAAGDVFDLRTALAATSWNGQQSTLADYLLVRDVGNTSIISIDADGKGAGPAADIAVLNDSAGLTYAGLLAQATLPALKQPTISPAIKIITGNTDGGVTLAGTSTPSSTVTVTDTIGGRTTSLGVAVTAASGAWSFTSHAKIDMSSVNTFGVSAQDASGNYGAMAGGFFLGSTLPDTIVGTAGTPDVFAVMSFRGADVITGFEPTSIAGSSHDVVDLSGRNITSFAQVQSMTSGASSAVISIGSGKTITLTGIASSALTAADFRFS